MRWSRSAMTAMMVAVLGTCPISALEYFFDSAKYRTFLGDLNGMAVIRHPDHDNVLVVVSLPGLEEYELIHEQPVPTQSRTTVYNPRVSPDGKWVTYDMWPDGIGPTNRMVVQRLDPANPERFLVGYGCEPEWWRDPADSSLHLVYGSRNDQDNVDRYPGKTFMRRFEEGELVGAEVELLDQAYKGGLSQDGRWLGTANKSVYLYDTREDSIAGLYAIDGGSTCYERMNPTADPERMDQICFINTSHDTLLTYTSAGERVWEMTMPAMWQNLARDTRPWQSNGWSNHEDLMLTGFRNTTFEQCMALVRRSDKMMLPLCIGGPHQDMWIEGAPLYSPATNVRPSVLPHRPTRSSAAVRSVVVGAAHAPAARRYDLRGALLKTAPRGMETVNGTAFLPLVIERSR